MITETAFEPSTTLQTSGGGVSLELVLLIGLAAIVVIAVAWLLTSGTGSD